MKVKNSDLLKETTGIIVHGCNAQGVFNAGIARQIRVLYPVVYTDYMNQFNKSGLSLGDIIVTKINSDLFFVSAITQKYYGRDSNKRYASYSAIFECFKKINKIALQLNLPVKFPLIGAGLGNAKWNIVEDIINKALDKDIEKILFKIQ